MMDSVQKLAAFLDTHNLTDFEDELEEVTEKVFGRPSATVIRLKTEELAMAALTLEQQHIEADPAIAGGKPRIAGRRITVQNIVIWHERMGLSPDQIATEYDLSLAEVYAALAYYFDHRAEIDRSIAESESFAANLRQQTPSKLQRKLQGVS